jgi:uncharacterized sulfatase
MPLLKGENKEIKEYSFSLQTTRGTFNGSDYYGIRAVVDKNYRYIWNLTPEVEFKNDINNNPHLSLWWKSWLEKAKYDEHAKSLIERYSKRPSEELYDVVNDKWCINNLADDPQYEQIKRKLRNELLKWMKECGDKGQETELEAFKHMPSKQSSED